MEHMGMENPLKWMISEYLFRPGSRVGFPQRLPWSIHGPVPPIWETNAGMDSIPVVSRKFCWGNAGEIIELNEFIRIYPLDSSGILKTAMEIHRFSWDFMGKLTISMAMFNS